MPSKQHIPISSADEYKAISTMFANYVVQESRNRKFIWPKPLLRIMLDVMVNWYSETGEVHIFTLYDYYNLCSPCARN